MLKRNSFIWVLTLLSVLAMVISACSQPAAPPPAEPTKAPAPTEASKPATATEEVKPVATEESNPTAAAATEESKPAEATAESSAAPAGNLSKTLVIAEQEQPASFDPMNTDNSTVNRMTVAIYDALVQYKTGTTEIEPALAESWEVSADGTEYTFKLRSGVKFHDGSDLTADDVKYTFDRLKAINQGIASVLTNFKEATVVDASTIKLTLTKPSAPFFGVLPKIFIANKKLLEANTTADDWGQAYLKDHDAGSGPFKLVRFQPEQEIVLERHADYWRGWQPNQPEGVIWRIIKEAATQRLLLEKGEIDIASDPSRDDLGALKENKDVSIETGTTLVEYYLHLRTNRPPLDDVKVRKAIALAYDYQAHIDSVLGGLGEQAQGPYSKGVLFHNDQIEKPSLNIEEAKKLLTEAGHADGGFSLKIGYLPVLEEEARSVEILQAGLAQLGIEVQAEGMTWPTMAGLMQDEKSEIDVYTVYAFPSSPDPDDALRVNYHCDARTAAYNSAWYCNEKVDELMDKAVTLVKPEEREPLYKEIQQMIADDQPSLFISNPMHVLAVRTWVKGYKYNPTHHETINVGEITLDGKP